MDAKAKDDRALDITAVAADPEPHRGNPNHIGIVLQDELDGTMTEQMKAAHAALWAATATPG